jgi:organic radical activating enzyme
VDRQLEKTFFPIKTATACQLKWTWSTIFLNDGTTASCHRVGRHPVSLEDFDSFHNTPTKIDQRNTMLRGEWPQPLSYMHPDQGCRFCQKIEESGGQSDRMYHMQVPDLSPFELDQDPTAVVVTPRILEVFMGNTCNLSCTYCDAGYSSQIERENQKFGHFEKNGLVIHPIKVDRDLNALCIEKFFAWLEKNSMYLRRLHLLGGEPLYQKEFYRCMDFFCEHPNRDLEFNLVTNLMISTDKFSLLVDRWKQMLVDKKIKRVDVTVSLDCWSKEQEYARYGLDLELMQKNLQILLDAPWIYFNINSTLSPLTLKTFPELVEKINGWKKKRKINQHFQTVFFPEHHNPDIFGPDFWKADLDRALSVLPTSDWQEKNSFNYFQGMAKQIQNSRVKPEQILKLITHLDELDRRRNTNWQSLFPYIEDWRNRVV